MSASDSLAQSFLYAASALLNEAVFASSAACSIVNAISPDPFLRSTLVFMLSIGLGSIIEIELMVFNVDGLMVSIASFFLLTRSL